MDPSVEFYSDFNTFSEFQMFMGFFSAFFIVFFAIGITAYVLEAIAIKNLSKTLKHPDPWLAFIPGAQSYMLGYIADARSVINDRKRTKYRILLPVFNCVSILSVFLFYFLFIFLFLYIGISSEYNNIDFDTGFLGLSIFCLIFSLLLFALSIVSMVYNYIALYNVYKVFKPNSAVAFLVLSIFVNVSIPIILFCIRKEMPKQDEVYYVPQPQTLPPQYQQSGYNQYNGQNYQQSPVQNYQQTPVKNVQPPVQNFEEPAQPVQPSVQSVEVQAQDAQHPDETGNNIDE